MPLQNLDHIILPLPLSPTTPLPSIPPFISQNFTLTPGGTHADALTSNTLILLSDGCYIELLTFLAPSSPSVQTHWWARGARDYGWIDWCLTNALSAEESFAAIRNHHAAPVPGGRTRADGVEVKWAVTFPKGENSGQKSRGRVPFFCHDVTERGVRVPLSSENTRHESGVVGVREITVIVKDERVLEETRGVYEGLFGGEEERRGEEVWFKLGRVRGVEGLEGGARIVLRLPRGEEVERLGEGEFWFGDVVLAAKAGRGEVVGTRRRLDEGGESVKGFWVEYV